MENTAGGYRTSSYIVSTYAGFERGGYSVYPQAYPAGQITYVFFYVPKCRSTESYPEIWIAFCTAVFCCHGVGKLPMENFPGVIRKERGKKDEKKIRKKEEAHGCSTVERGGCLPDLSGVWGRGDGTGGVF